MPKVKVVPFLQKFLKMVRKKIKLILFMKNLDILLIKKINCHLYIFISLVIFDIFINIGISLIEYFLFGKDTEKDIKFKNFLIEIGIIIFISFIIIILLVLMKKILCLIGGLTYLILGVLFWLYKSLYSCYLFFSGEIEEYFGDDKEEDDNNYYFFYAIIILVNISLISIRLICCYNLKKIYGLLENIEKYNFEREHTIFFQKIEEDLQVNLIKDDINGNEEEGEIKVGENDKNVDNNIIINNDE